MGTTVKDYQDALDVGMAVNASGVIHSLSDVVSRIWEDARELGEGTHYVNAHPIVITYLDALLLLAGVFSSASDCKVYDAYHDCRRVVNGELTTLLKEKEA